MKLGQTLKRIVVRRETLPERCEICHQDDCFDPVKNYCSRCNPVVPNSKPVTKPAVITAPEPTVESIDPLTGKPWIFYPIFSTCTIGGILCAYLLNQVDPQSGSLIAQGIRYPLGFILGMAVGVGGSVVCHNAYFKIKGMAMSALARYRKRRQG